MTPADGIGIITLCSVLLLILSATLIPPWRH